MYIYLYMLFLRSPLFLCLFWCLGNLATVRTIISLDRALSEDPGEEDEVYLIIPCRGMIKKDNQINIFEYKIK